MLLQNYKLKLLLNTYEHTALKTSNFTKYNLLVTLKDFVCQYLSRYFSKLSGFLWNCSLRKVFWIFLLAFPMFSTYNFILLMICSINGTSYITITWCLNSGPDIYSCICWGIFTPKETICEFYFDINFKTWFFWGTQKYICLKYNSIL